MRGGYNVYAKCIEHWDAKFDTIVDTWYEASSPTGHLHTTCGHRHTSYAEAEVCIPEVEKVYREKRWPKKHNGEQTNKGI
jgi:hypothetical protein